MVASIRRSSAALGSHLYHRVMVNRSYLAELGRHQTASLSSRSAMVEESISQFLTKLSRLDGGPHPSQAMSAAALSTNWLSLPIQTKSDVRALFDMATNHGIPAGYTVGRSGGSTGEPLQFLMPKSQLGLRRTASSFARLQIGWRPGMPVVALWGADKRSSGLRARLEYWKSAVRGSFVIPAFAVGKPEFAEAARLIESLKPVALYGYTGHLELFAEWAEVQDLRLDASVAVVWNGAEGIEERAADSFNRNVNLIIQNLYGAREVGPIAVSREGRLNLETLSPWCLVEVVDSNGNPTAPGVEGDVLVTNLQSGGTPFVRYRIGDRAVSGGADICGLFCSNIVELRGRKTESVLLPDGRSLSVAFWHGLMKIYPSAKQYQVLVHSTGIEIRFTGKLDEDSLAEIKKKVERQAPGLPVWLKHDNLERTAIGKVPVVVYCNT